MRSLSISLLSLTLTSIVIANAYYQKKQFYPSVVYITKSNPSMAVIYIQAFICVWISGKIMRKIFFGQLRTTEFEHLMERSWYAITETCLAFTVFRDDFNPKFVALFTLLLFLKSFHWLAEDRVDYMERSPVISWLFHVRVLSLLPPARLALTCTSSSSPEHAILLTVVINIAIKYALHSVDLNSEMPWDNKAVFLLYTELIMGLIKVIFYVAFVAIMVRIYTLPLFAFRPMYYTIRNFKKALSDVILSRRAIHNMNTLYPDATPEELIAADNKLPCNHIFHTSCLRSWFQRQQTCPTCRLNILRTPANNNNARPAQQGPRLPPQNVFMNQFLIGPNPIQFFNRQNLGNMGPQQQQPPQPAQPDQPNQQQPAASGAAPGAAAAQPQAAVPRFPSCISRSYRSWLRRRCPPQNLATLSPEELQRMEGNERENVEARIQCLRNIQVLLDAAVVMMQQYNATVTASTQSPHSSSQPNVAPINIPQPSTLLNPSNHNATATVTPDQHDPAQTAATAPSTSTRASSSTDGGTSTEFTKPSTSKELETEARESPMTPEEEVRRRRLQRFQQPAEAQQ
ncbi:hypothetical protein NQ318_017553 [Aromia moschata]|uniref:RING-type E3 ubiquitin transferase n=1 Tax=Aromia moschata TaxID=1265417 RepID=A0AAV8Z2A4_9CUCU|nr:hypothetical protein NQ318_017553 [Aromia moschata]